MIRVIFLIIILSSFLCSEAQQTLKQYHHRKKAISSKGMVALGTWSVANIAIGTYQTIKLDKSDDKYFHQMNAIWNTVNFTIAVVGLVSSHKSKVPDSWDEMRKQQSGSELALLINIGLDVAYIGGGLSMSLVAEDTRGPNIIKGYGQSFMLQGAYLLIMDIVQYTLHRVHEKRHMQKSDISGQLIRY